MLHYCNCVGGVTMAARLYCQELTWIQNTGASWQEAIALMQQVAKFLYKGIYYSTDIGGWGIVLFL